MRVVETGDHPTLGVGFASIRINGVPAVAGDVQLFIKRSGYLESELGLSGWQTTEHALRPHEARAVDGDLELVVGPTVVGYMESSNYRVELIAGPGAERFSGVMTWRNVTPCAPPSQAAARGALELGSSKDGLSTATEPTVKRSDPPPKSDPPKGGGPEKPSADPPKSSGDPPPIEAVSRGRRLGMFAAVAAVLAGVAVGAYFLLDRGAPPPIAGPAADNPSSAPQTPDTSAPVDDSLAYWARRGAAEQYERARRFVGESAASGDPAGALGNADRLYDLAKDQGHAAAALERGRLYDPRELTPARDRQLPADPTTAYTMYRKAQELGSAEAEAELRALRAAVQALADGGDRAAADLLRRRWPE